MITPDEFVDLIREVVRDPAIESTVSNLANPPGRNPKKELVELSSWFKSLSNRDQDMVQRVLAEAVDSSVFGFFCILDGVRSISLADEVYEIELMYNDGSGPKKLNDQESVYLHDIYNTGGLSR